MKMLVNLQTNGLMPKHQSIYRRVHTTETALLKVTSDALLAADQGKLILLSMFDLSAAFDCVDHDILLNQFAKTSGFFGMAIGWIRSYLTGRRQYGLYSESMSTVTPMLFGVPRSSMLGPLLFILYTADVFRIAEELDFSIHGMRTYRFMIIVLSMIQFSSMIDVSAPPCLADYFIPGINNNNNNTQLITGSWKHKINFE